MFWQETERISSIALIITYLRGMVGKRRKVKKRGPDPSLSAIRNLPSLLRKKSPFSRLAESLVEVSSSTTRLIALVQDAPTGGGGKVLTYAAGCRISKDLKKLKRSQQANQNPGRSTRKADALICCQAQGVPAPASRLKMRQLRA